MYRVKDRGKNGIQAAGFEPITHQRRVLPKELAFESSFDAVVVFE